MRAVPLLALALLWTMPGAADEAAWLALAQPGTAALMRHAAAPGIGDPAGFRLDDCATQRNLDSIGRADAQAVGAAFRARGIQIDRVLTSRWCRCRETARLLALAPVEDFPPLDSLFGQREAAPERSAAVRALLAERAGTDKLVLVTHQVNIQALTGSGLASGEIIVVATTPGGLEVRGRMTPGEWR